MNEPEAKTRWQRAKPPGVVVGLPGYLVGGEWVGVSGVGSARALALALALVSCRTASTSASVCVYVRVRDPR